MRNRLIIFTRFPVPGKTKTRLIHTLGEQGAADLQEIMMGLMAIRARLWAAAGGGEVEIRHTGAPGKDFEKWLGRDFIYRRQATADLGERMSEAAESALNDGCEKIVIVGCDCPAIDAATISAAFSALDDYPLVIGPAQDGGYYLIGMSRPHPHLFKGIIWGTESVLEETLTIARGKGDSFFLLDTLRDIDTEEDLPAWEEQYKAGEPGSVSVVIPALNEAEGIAATVTRATKDTAEVIVADGGSTDQTKIRAADAGARVIDAPRGRGNQMNAGALAARGESVLFLHADAALPDRAVELARQALQKPNTVAGAFALAIDDPHRAFRAIEWAVRTRGFPYGDQGLFMKRDTFLRLGGFHRFGLLEDVDMVKRLKHRGHVAVLTEPMHVSPRRWQKKGVTRTSALNLVILAAYNLGVSPDRLADWYYRR